MTDPIRITFDHADFGRKLNQSLKRYPKAAAAGINRAARGTFTLSVRLIQQDLGASTQKAIRSNLYLKAATADRPRAELAARSAKKERMPIFQLNPRPKTVTRRRPVGGVRYGKRNTLIPGSFIGRMKKSGHMGVFKREGSKRLPIKELFGPSIALIFSRRKIQAQISDYLQTKIPQEIARAFRFVDQTFY
jgi:hypothetical protein